MFVERNVSLQPLNSFGIAARAAHMVRVRSEDEVRAVLADAGLTAAGLFVLGGGSNIVLTGDVPSPARPPAGCRFHPRCFLAQADPAKLAVCRGEDPALREVAPGHFVACHHA